MTNQLELRPVDEDDLPLLQKLTQDPVATGEFGRFGWFDPRRWRRGWDDNGLIGPDGGTLVVVRDGEPVGMMNWRRRPTTPAAYCWEMGIALLPEARPRVRHRGPPAAGALPVLAYHRPPHRGRHRGR